MRKIAFRAWDEKEQKMWNENNILVGGGVFLYGGNTLDPEIYSYTRHDDFIPLQYTGLLDKNDKEIYEGDIVRTNGVNVEIVFEKNGWYPTQIWLNGQYNEIIGNIYENSELLK